MNDPFVDPRFPDRPQHPDFWRLVSAVNYLDGEATEGGRSSHDILAEFIDVESVAYMSQQRFMRALMAANGELDYRALALSLYMDAFALGCQFTKEAQKEE